MLRGERSKKKSHLSCMHAVSWTNFFLFCIQINLANGKTGVGHKFHSFTTFPYIWIMIVPHSRGHSRMTWTVVYNFTQHHRWKLLLQWKTKKQQLKNREIKLYFEKKKEFGNKKVGVDILEISWKILKKN